MNIILEYYGNDYYIAELEYPEQAKKLDIWGLSWYTEIDDWCTRTFGPQDMWGEEPVSGWKKMRNKYYFTKDSQRAFFILKWA